MALADLRDTLTGDVIVIFQPAEETTAGARLLISHGLFDHAPMAALFGLHNTPEITVGRVGLKQGTLMAAKNDFRISVHGKGGHGALPQLCTDPIIAACAVVGALQSVISRNISPQATAVVSVCSIHGGCANNLTPDQICMAGSARTFDEKTQAKIIRRIEEITHNTAAAYGCTANIEFYASTPPLVNSDALYDTAKIAADRTVTPENVLESPINFASEDFALYGAYVPSFFYFLGSGVPNKENASWHSAFYQADSDTVFWGAELLKNSVLEAQQRMKEPLILTNPAVRQ
jgi:amidohydrolase